VHLCKGFSTLPHGSHLFRAFSNGPPLSWFQYGCHLLKAFNGKLEDSRHTVDLVYRNVRNAGDLRYQVLIDVG